MSAFRASPKFLSLLLFLFLIPPPSQAAAVHQNGTAAIRINLVDGTRHPLPQDVTVLVRVMDGNHKAIYTGFLKASTIIVKDLPVYENYGDLYSVTVSASGYFDSGYFPVHVERGTVSSVSAMLIPRHYRYDFTGASFDELRQSHPEIWGMFAEGLHESNAQKRYSDFMAAHPDWLASSFNILTALHQVDLDGTPAGDYFKGFVWDDYDEAVVAAQEMAFDRDHFYAYVDKRLLDEIERHPELWEKQHFIQVFHPGSTAGFKEKQFSQGHLHISFYATQTKVINGVECMKVQIHIDLYRDLMAHSVLEVIPDTLADIKTDPRKAYELRWIASQQEETSEQSKNFNPPFTIVPLKKK